MLKSYEGSSESERKSSVQFIKCIGLTCISLNLGIGMEVTTDTLSWPFLISPTYLKLVPYEAKNCCSLFQVLELSEYEHKGKGQVNRNLSKSNKHVLSKTSFTVVMAQTIYEGIYTVGVAESSHQIQVITTLSHNIRN